jgi:hypothetical protein
MKRRTVTRALFVVFAAIWLAFTAGPVAAEEEGLPSILVHAKHGDKAASQARALGWAAVTLGGINLIVLAYVVLRLSGSGWSLLGDAEWPVRAIRRRQTILGKSIGELNAHFQDVDADRQQLGELLKSINEQLQTTAHDIEEMTAARR